MLADLDFSRPGISEDPFTPSTGRTARKFKELQCPTLGGWRNKGPRIEGGLLLLSQKGSLAGHLYFAGKLNDNSHRPQR